MLLARAVLPALCNSLRERRSSRSSTALSLWTTEKVKGRCGFLWGRFWARIVAGYAFGATRAENVLEGCIRAEPSNGGGEIRTPETGVTRLLVFETSAFIRSATPPGRDPTRLVDQARSIAAGARLGSGGHRVVEVRQGPPADRRRATFPYGDAFLCGPWCGPLSWEFAPRSGPRAANSPLGALR